MSQQTTVHEHYITCCHISLRLYKAVICSLMNYMVCSGHMVPQNCTEQCCSYGGTEQSLSDMYIIMCLWNVSQGDHMLKQTVNILLFTLSCACYNLVYVLFVYKTICANNPTIFFIFLYALISLLLGQYRRDYWLQFFLFQKFQLLNN